LHSIIPSWQESSHAPAPLQMNPSSQAVPSSDPEQSPEAPQYERSVKGSMQVPLHSISPFWHESSHVPAPLQMNPSWQVTPSLAPEQSPEAPQCVRSVRGSMHFPSQFINPDWQDSSHVPAPLQINPSSQAVPAFSSSQLPEAPQYVRSVRGSMQAPPQ
jgi:hypothetical protein